jgi:hypothetical protein
MSPPAAGRRPRWARLGVGTQLAPTLRSRHRSSLPPPPVGRDDGRTCSLNLGTFWGPHVVRDRERPARLCTLRTAAHWPSTVGDLRNALPLFTGGSSGAGHGGRLHCGISHQRMATKRRSALLSLFTVSPISPFDYDRLAAARKARPVASRALETFPKARDSARGKLSGPAIALLDPTPVR